MRAVTDSEASNACDLRRQHVDYMVPYHVDVLGWFKCADTSENDLRVWFRKEVIGTLKAIDATGQW